MYLHRKEGVPNAPSLTYDRAVASFPENLQPQSQQQRPVINSSKFVMDMKKLQDEHKRKKMEEEERRRAVEQHEEFYKDRQKLETANLYKF